MRALFLQWVISALVLLLTAYLVPGFQVAGFGSALIAAAVVGFANIAIRPFLLFVTLPINILTLGLFTVIVNAMVLKLCAYFTPGFTIATWGAAILGAILISIFNLLSIRILHPPV